VPLPPSLSHGARSPLVVHTPRPFHPELASSMRPSRPFAEKLSGYGTRNTTHLPSTSASSASFSLPVEIGTSLPRPKVLC